MSLKSFPIRNRSSNFTKVEKILVAKLCRDNPDIDAKEYDKVTLQRKHDAWNNIMVMYKEEISKKDFNLPERDVKQLQGCWKRLKDQIRRCNNLNIKTKTTEANGSYMVLTNGYPVSANGEPFSVNPDIYDNDDETEDESSADNSNFQSQIEKEEDQVSFNPALRIKEEITLPEEPISWQSNDGVVNFINPVSSHPLKVTTTSSDPHSETTHVPNVHVLERTKHPVMRRTRKRRLSDDEDEDSYVQMAQEEHQLKMKILQLKEWKLRRECVQSGIGLPPDYEVPHNCTPRNISLC